MGSDGLAGLFLLLRMSGCVRTHLSTQNLAGLLTCSKVFLVEKRIARAGAECRDTAVE